MTLEVGSQSFRLQMSTGSVEEFLELVQKAVALTVSREKLHPRDLIQVEMGTVMTPFMMVKNFEVGRLVEAYGVGRVVIHYVSTSI